MSTEAADERHDPIARVVGVLDDRFDELVDIMCEAVRAESATYAALRERAGFRASIARTARLYAGSLRAGGRLGDDALTALHVVGAERCRQGVPESEMLDAVRWAARAGAAFLIRVGGKQGFDAAAVAELASVVSTSMLDFVSDVQRALATGWRTEDAHRLPAGVRGRATLVDRLVDGGCSEAELYDFARDEGVDLRPPCLPLLVVAGAGGNGVNLQAVGSALAGRLPGSIEGGVRTSPVPHVIVAVGNATDKRMKAVLEGAESVARAHKVVIVVGPAAERLDGASAAHARASAHLEFARFERRPPGLLRSERLRVYGVLARLTLEERADLCLSVLEPVVRLRAAKCDELLTTFEAVGDAGGSHTEAAVSLGPGVNAHTVKYRLRRLETLTGLRCDIDGERLLLSLAVRAYRAWVAAALEDEPAPGQPWPGRSSSVTRPHTAR